MKQQEKEWEFTVTKEKVKNMMFPDSSVVLNVEDLNAVNRKYRDIENEIRRNWEKLFKIVGASVKYGDDIEIAPVTAENVVDITESLFSIIVDKTGGEVYFYEVWENLIPESMLESLDGKVISKLDGILKKYTHR